MGKRLQRPSFPTSSIPPPARHKARMATAHHAYKPTSACTLRVQREQTVHYPSLASLFASMRSGGSAVAAASRRAAAALLAAPALLGT